MEEEDKEDEKPLQAKREGSRTAELHPDLESSLRSLQGGGQPLTNSVRTFFEPRFGCDFGQVRLHTNEQVQALARIFQAQAFTLDRHIFFGAGKYPPETGEGRQILAHELTHVIQQGGSSPRAGIIQRAIGEGHDLNSPRFKGDPDLEAAYDDEKYIRRGDAGPAVAKLQQALMDAGYALPVWGVDGKFGSETENAMKKFQGGAGIAKDGVVGPETMDALDRRFGPGAAPAPEVVTPYQYCTPQVTGVADANARLEEARMRAIQYVADARTALQADPIPSTTYDTALRRHFISPNSAQRQLLVEVYGNIMAWLDKRRNFVCGTEKICGNHTAYHWWKHIVLCPPYWPVSPVCQSIILIHEAAHGSGVSVGWHAPRRGSPSYPMGDEKPSPSENTQRRIFNSDAYAFFAHHVSVGADTSTNCRESP